MGRRLVGVGAAVCLAVGWLACGGAYDSSDPVAPVAEAGTAPLGEAAGPSVDAGSGADADADAEAEAPIIDAGPDVRSPFDAAVPPGVSVTMTGACSYHIVVDGSAFGLDLWELLAEPTCAAAVSLHVTTGSTIGASTTAAPALTIAGFASGSSIDIANEGRIAGRGGDGGSGGNGGSGGSPKSCARVGAKGGSALRIDAEVTFTSIGEIYGGGGGGAGASGDNENAGGGGGAGSQPGAGGAKASTLTQAQEIAFCGQDNGIRTGTAGKAGTADLGGAAITLDLSCQSGAGGTPGTAGKASNCTGGASGGAAGLAIEYGNNATTLPVPLGSSPVTGVKGSVAKVP